MTLLRGAPAVNKSEPSTGRGGGGEGGVFPPLNFNSLALIWFHFKKSTFNFTAARSRRNAVNFKPKVALKMNSALQLISLCAINVVFTDTCESKAQ